MVNKNMSFKKITDPKKGDFIVNEFLKTINEAIDVGKTVAINNGISWKAAKKLSTPKSQVANLVVPTQDITKKVNEVIAKYVDTSAINLNKLKDGSSVHHPIASNAIAIQDLVKRLNWSGLKVT